MSRIKDYPEATSMADDDILVIDGDNGTRKVKKSKFVEIISEHVDGEISEMRQDFQAGVETIYDAIVAEGVTPSASTPQACATGIAKMETDVYNAIVAKGVTPAADTIPGCVAAIPNVYTKGKTDAEAVTWTEDFALPYGGADNSEATMFIGNAISIKLVGSGGINGYCYYFFSTSFNGSSAGSGKVYNNQTLTIPSNATYVMLLSDANPNGGTSTFKITRQAKILR